MSSQVLPRAPLVPCVDKGRVLVLHVLLDLVWADDAGNRQLDLLLLLLGLLDGRLPLLQEQVTVVLTSKLLQANNQVLIIKC